MYVYIYQTQFYIKAMTSTRFYNSNKAKRNSLIEMQKINKLQPNQQENATSRLLQISNQYDCTEFSIAHQYDQMINQKRYNYSPDKDLRQRQNNSSKKKINSDIYSKTQKAWNRNNNKYLSGEEVCVMKKDKVINLSSFLIIQNDHLPNVTISPSKSKFQAQSETKINSKLKNSNNLINFIRKRNIHININSENLNQSTQCNHQYNKNNQRINMSCQLKRQKISPIKLNINNQEQSFCRSSSPAFKNKLKISNYIRFRMSKYK